MGICGALLDTSGASLGSFGSPRHFLGYDVIPGKILRRALERVWEAVERDLQRLWNFEIDVLELLGPLLDVTFS